MLKTLIDMKCLPSPPPQYQFRARRVLSHFKDVPLRTRSALYHHRLCFVICLCLSACFAGKRGLFFGGGGGGGWWPFSFLLASWKWLLPPPPFCKNLWIRHWHVCIWFLRISAHIENLWSLIDLQNILNMSRVKSTKGYLSKRYKFMFKIPEWTLILGSISKILPPGWAASQWSLPTWLLFLSVLTYMYNWRFLWMGKVHILLSHLFPK